MDSMYTMYTMETGDGRRMLGAGDLSPLLGVSRPQVTELATHEWFPAPVLTRAEGADRSVVADAVVRVWEWPRSALRAGPWWVG